MSQCVMSYKFIKSFTLVISIFLASEVAQALSGQSIESLFLTRDSKVSFYFTKKTFDSVATAEKKTLKEIVAELQDLDPDYGTELVLDEDFFKLSFILDNGWDVELPNSKLEDLLVVALRQQHTPIIQLVLKSGGWKILLKKKNEEILKQAGIEHEYYSELLSEWERPEKKLNYQPESYEYRVDGKSRDQKRKDLEEESVAMSPAGGAARPVQEFTTVPVPYATNRAMDDRLRSKIHTIDGAASFYSFTNAGAISYGIANVTIPRTHKKGKLEDRGILEFKYNPANHVILQNLHLKTSEEFFSDLGEMFKAREAAFPDSTQAKELFVYIHGFNVDFSYAMRKTAQLMYDMDYPGISIAFSWPARAVNVPLPNDFRDDVTRAEASEAVLELFLKQVIEKYPDRKIHIIAHSLGSRVLSRVIVNIAKTLNPNRMMEGVKKVFGEVILAAPAMDAHTFVNTMASEMTPLCDRVSIYASDDDYALKVEHLAEGPNFSFPLGLWDNKADIRGISDGVTHYDLSNLSAGTFSLDHSVYSEVPVALDHMKLILNHRPTDVDLGTLGYVRKANALDFFTRKAKEFWQFLEI